MILKPLWRPSLTRRLESLLILGPTGAGKSPLGSLLSRRGLAGRACHHFDFGHELRQVANGAPGFSEAERAFVREVLFQGRLLEDKDWPLAARIFEAFLVRVQPRPADLLVLNGLPRHIGQAQAMEDLIEVKFICLLEANLEVVCRRLESNVGGDREGRDDDTQSLIFQKYKTYLARTHPLLDYYRERAKILKIPVGADTRPEETYRALLKLLAREGVLELAAP